MRKYGIPFMAFGIAPFHPNSAESETSGEQAMNFYTTLLASGRNFVVPRPNNDKGTEKVQEVLDALPKDRVCVVPNFEFNDYVVLLKQAGCVAGNSSVVVTSAPAIGKLCLNIGTRQQGRTPPTDGLFNFSPNDREGILKCLRENWGKTYATNNHYGDGCAAERFLEALSSRSFWEVSQQKLLFNQKAS
jgi:UDP-N-acetylglucosamine 2-epimerase (hydrolysing)